MTRHFECTILGVPKSPAARSKSSWQEAVRFAAENALPPLWNPVATPVTAVIVYFHRGAASGIDVDNMAKPILDAIEGLVLENDQLVEQLIARRTLLRDDLHFRDVTPPMAAALNKDTDFVLIRIEDAPDHGVIP